MEEIRRPEDDELCGYVESRGERWAAVTVFGGTLAVLADRDAAERIVRTDGLASLADRWLLREGATGDEIVVCIQEASPAGVSLALDYYSLPGVPTKQLSRRELTSGEWELRRTD